MDEPRWAADLFEFDDDEKRALNMKDFFVKYKNKFPMLAIFIGGWYGDTHYDCYDNMQVFRIHCVSSQRRIIALDDRESKTMNPKFHTIPVDTPVRFQVIQSHSKVDNNKALPYILENAESFPILVKMGCDPRYELRIGTGRGHASHFGSLLITEQYLEHYLMINCIQGVELELTKTVNMVALSEDLAAAPITGFKHKPQHEFDQFLQKLSRQVETGGEAYDTTRGNPNIAEYFVRDINPATGQGGIPTVPHPTLPDLLEPVHNQDDSDYEEIPPELPSRPAVVSSQPTKNITKGNSPKSPSSESSVGKKGMFSSWFGKPKEQSDPVVGSAQEKKKQSVPVPVESVPTTQQTQMKPTTLQTAVKHKKPVPLPTESDKMQGHTNTNEKHVHNNPDKRPAILTPDKTTNEQGGGKRSVSHKRRPTVEPDIRKLKHEALTEPTAREDIYSEAYEHCEPSDRYVKIENVTTNSVRKKSPSYQALEGPQISNVEQISNENITSMTIKEVTGILNKLSLAKYSEQFEEGHIDGVILSNLTVDDLVSELGMKKLEAIRLYKFVTSGHIPK